jgi:hypothetical protein
MKKHITANNHKGVTETGIIMQVCTLMNNRGYCVWRHINTGAFNARKAADLILPLFEPLRSGQLSQANFEKAVKNALSLSWGKTPGIFPGIFDITGFNLSTGKLVAIEIKLGSDDLRPEQRDFMAKVKAAGGEVYVVRDFPLFSKNFRAREAVAAY